MKILLIQSNLDQNTFPEIFPLGISYIARFLNTHSVKIFDPNISINHIVNLTGIIDEFQPNVIGISLRNIDNQSRIHPLNYYADFCKLLHIIKEKNTSAKIIVGGTGFSMFAREIMETNPEIDFGVYLEGEEAFAELVNNLEEPEKTKGIYYRENGRVLFSGMRKFTDFEKSLPPRRELIDHSKYISEISIGIQTQRGCALKCAYCNYPSLNGYRLRTRSPSSVADEIETLIHNHGVKTFIFTNSVFNKPIEHATNICEEIIKRGLHNKVNWICWLDLRGITKNFLLLLKKAGCTSISFSPDGLSNSSLNSLRKGITEKDVWNILKLIVTVPELKDIHFQVGLFINTPGETNFGMLRILFYKFLSLAIKKILKRDIYVHIGWIRLEPDTEIYDVALKQGIVSENRSLLPSSKADVKSLFYLNPSLKYMDKFALRVVSILDFIKEKNAKIKR